MNIFMWSGPRNLSTALMRSFENRNDAEVWDEPFYAYYLKETNKDHPMANKIIQKYENDSKKIIKKIVSFEKIDKIFYQKHMTHHMLEQTNLNWISHGINCFLIRDPKDVILSYSKKNILTDSNDIGFPMQLKIFNMVKKFSKKIIVINADDLSSNPKKILQLLCKNLDISFSEKMINWPKGERKTDGIWESIWYNNVKSSSKFEILVKKNEKIPDQYINIYNKCLSIYQEINSYNILYER
tara:strand:+ start:230 stop:952 length:723 start_codon:yes stop_codon:yes gene_type:complete